MASGLILQTRPARRLRGHQTWKRTITLLSARDRPARPLRTGCHQIRATRCCCSKPGGRAIRGPLSARPIASFGPPPDRSPRRNANRVPRRKIKDEGFKTVAPSQEPGDRNALPSRALYPSSHYPQPSIEIAPINSVPEISLCPGHQQVSEGCREPAYHTTALQSGPAHRVHGRAYATCLKTCGSPVAQGAERPSPWLAGRWRKAKPWGLLEKSG